METGVEAREKREKKAFNDIPEEKERRWRAPDGRNEVGFSLRVDGEPGRVQLEEDNRDVSSGYQHGFGADLHLHLLFEHHIQQKNRLV
uniref:Uncharacterized protein n=1 Tax=Vespula pensylvanica TaxID=30213 RepID=A0A834UGS7_VESPE|nr:hypothetical protein H0235_000874 [Vespula pensylvanica]